METGKAPRSLVLIVTAAIALILFFGRGGVSGKNDALVASLHLDDTFLLYFQSSPAHEPTEADVDVLNRLTSEYVAIVKKVLDGKVEHQYDTLVHGFSFRLDHTSKVHTALGSENVPQDVVQTTDDRLYKFLHMFKAAEMDRSGVTMTLERDKSMSTQGEGIV